MSSGNGSSALKISIVAAVAAAAIIGIPWWLFGQPSFEEVRRYAAFYFVKATPGPNFTVLVADLQADKDLSQTALLAEALEESGGLEVVRTGRTLVASGVNKVLQESKETGKSWLSDKNADVLVWGHDTGSNLILRFLARTGERTRRESGNRFGQELELPRNFEKVLGTALVAAALSHVAPAAEQQGTYLVSLLRPVATKLKSLLAARAAGLPLETRASLHASLGLAAGVVGAQTGENNWLEEAVTAFQAALKERTRERVPVQWAATQNNLGNALAILGERESGTARLEEAMAAYRAALEEQTRERVPVQWAMTQNNLGTALATLGERESGTARLEEAVAAFREALEEGTRERVPLDWAMTQNNLGNALGALGDRESGTARLKEAVEAYRAALEERTRERVPLQWAMTQNNLGTALRALGERESGTARLEEGMAAYRAALEERTRERVPLDWAMTQNNLGNALARLGERESGTARLKEAMAAFRAALEERTRERVPLNWATTQNNLGTALGALGERESGTARLEDAVAAYRAALDVYEAASADYFVNLVTANLRNAEATLEARKTGRN